MKTSPSERNERDTILARIRLLLASGGKTAEQQQQRLLQVLGWYGWEAHGPALDPLGHLNAAQARTTYWCLRHLVVNFGWGAA